MTTAEEIELNRWLINVINYKPGNRIISIYYLTYLAVKQALEGNSINLCGLNKDEYNKINLPLLCLKFAHHLKTNPEFDFEINFKDLQGNLTKSQGADVKYIFDNINFCLELQELENLSKETPAYYFDPFRDYYRNLSAKEEAELQDKVSELKKRFNHITLTNLFSYHDGKLNWVADNVVSVALKNFKNEDIPVVKFSKDRTGEGIFI